MLRYAGREGQGALMCACIMDRLRNMFKLHTLVLLYKSAICTVAFCCIRGIFMVSNAGSAYLYCMRGLD